MAILAIFVGLIGGLAALIFFKLLVFVSSFWVPELSTDFNFQWAGYHYQIGIALLISSLIAGQILMRLEGNRPNGPADAILACNQDVNLHLKDGFLSSLLAFVSLCGGASVGLFGPLVHFGAVLGVWLNKRFTSLTKGVILSIGAASAVAAVFSIPIGGAIFAQEAILRKFTPSSFLFILIGSISSFLLSFFILGNHRFFPIDGEFDFSLYYLAMSIGIGILCGLLVSLYMYLIPAMGKLAKSSNIKPQWRPLIPAIALFIASPLLPHLLGSGLSTISLAVAGKLTLTLLIVLCFTKVLMTTFCLGFGFFGGVFGPALFIGAMLGASMDAYLGSGHAVFLAIAAAAMIASTIGAPVACVVIIFELTGNYSIAILSAVSISVAYQISKQLIGKSVFDYQLFKRGIVFNEVT
jgi:CIC family chloride channel protein